VSICVVVLKAGQPLSCLVVIREWISQLLWLVILLEFVVPIAAVAWLFQTKSDLGGKIYEEGSDNWQPWPSDNKPKKYRILRRYGPGEA
jgi:hypothetical protein